MSGRTRSRRRIQPDIEQTRTELDGTVTAPAAKTDVKAQVSDDTQQARAATKESVHDATARIKEAAERAAAQTTHKVADVTRAKPDVSGEKDNTNSAAKELKTEMTQAAKEKLDAAKNRATETTQSVKQHAAESVKQAAETTQAVKQQAAGMAQAAQEKAAAVREKAEIAKDRAITEKTVDLREQAAKSAETTQDLSARTTDHAAPHLQQPTAERATRAATTAADMGGHLVHQVAAMSHNLADTARHQLVDGRPADRLRRPIPLALAGAAVLALTGAIALLRHRRNR